MGEGLHERLKMAVDLSGAAAREIDRLADLTHGHTLAIVKGRKLTPEVFTIGALAMTMGLSLDWLILNNGDPPTEEEVRTALERARVHPTSHKAAMSRVLGGGRAKRLKSAGSKRPARPRPRATSRPTPLANARPRPALPASPASRPGASIEARA